MKYLGILLMVVGVVDLVGSYADFDLWGGFVGINLPEFLWQFSAYIEIALGYMLMKFSSSEAKSE